MIRWWRERSTQERWMLALIVVLLVGIAVRWAFVKEEVGAAFRQRLEHFAPPSAPSDAENEETPETGK